MHKRKTKGLLLHFDSIYEHWKALAKVTKRSVIKQDPSNILQEHINTIQQELSELNSVYDAYRRIDSPAHDMHHKLDKCKSVTSISLKNTQTQIQGIKEELFWPDANSVFRNSSVSPPASNRSTANSIHSNTLSLKRQEAAAEYAATQAALKIMAEQESHQEKLQKLLKPRKS